MEITKACITIILFAITGYFTNALAVHMLFRPHKQWTVFGFHVPLTPGLIPKEWEKISLKIGEAVTQLLHPSVLLELLAESDNLDEVYRMFDELIDSRPWGRVIPESIRYIVFDRLVTEFVSLPPEKFNLTRIVAKTLSTYQVEEMETMVKTIAAGELRAITRLGAVIGSLLGIIQIIMENF